MTLKNMLIKSKDINQISYEVKWHDYLRKWKKERDIKRDNFEFHASSLVDKNFCLVKAVLYKMVKIIDEVFPPSTLARFITGVDIHQKHQKFYKDFDMAYYIEKQFYSNFLKMTATPDGIIKFMHNTVVVEIKSMDHFPFCKLKEPPLNAYWQALIYMYIVGIPQAIIVIENKNNQELKIFKINFDAEKALKLIKRRVAILKCLEKNMIPLSKRICKKFNERKRCKFKDICFDKRKLREILRDNKNESIRD